MGVSIMKHYSFLNIFSGRIFLPHFNLLLQPDTEKYARLIQDMVQTIEGRKEMTATKGIANAYIVDIAVIDSVSAIADGKIGAAASAVENALAKAVPVAIGFLASLLGLDGISEKIKKIIETIQTPINKAIDWVINKAVELVKAAGKLIGIGKEEEKPEEDPEKAARVKAGLLAIEQEEQSYLHEEEISLEDAQKVATTVKQEHTVFTSIHVVAGDETWYYEYVASPGKVEKGRGKQSKRRISQINSWKNAHPKTKLIPDGEKSIPQSQVESYDKAQELMNDLVRKTATEGDASSEYAALLEAKTGEPVKGKLHESKINQYIAPLKRLLKDPNLPEEAKNTIEAKIEKMQDTIKYLANERESLPRAFRKYPELK
jgi:hypothetical protein